MMNVMFVVLANRALSIVKPWPNDANIFAQQMPTMLGINVGIVWPPMLGIVGYCWMMLGKV